MTRRQARWIECDGHIPGALGGFKCDQEFRVEGRLDWMALQARARAAGWQHKGDKHLCPAHRGRPFTSSLATATGTSTAEEGSTP